MPNFHFNRKSSVKVNSNSEQENSGISFTFRLSETLIAVVLGTVMAFGSGIVYANNQNQNINNCGQFPTSAK